MGEAFFDSVTTLAKHLKSKNETISPLRLQKTLYFLFAFYGASYGLLSNENEREGSFEGSIEYPKYLFNEDFEAWTYGPVIKDVYRLNKDGSLDPEQWTPTDEQGKAVESLIETVCEQLDKMGDFALVERSHEDTAWTDAYREGFSNKMNKDAIIDEYKSSVF